MYRKTLLILALALGQLTGVRAQKVYSITTGPGPDVSKSIGISWAADLDAGLTYVLYTKASDKDWSHATKVLPQQQEPCPTFYGALSTNPEGEDFYEDAVFVKCGAMVSGLKKDTDYKYVIKAADGSSSGEKHFRTAGSAHWSCAVISDFHSYPKLPGRLESAMGVIDKIRELDPSVDWVLSAGDVVSYGSSYSYWRRLFEEPNFANLMWARANGNHDNWTKVSMVTRDFDIPNDYFTGTSYYPRNGYEGEMGVCYHFRYGNTLFMMLNTEDMKKPGEFEAAADWVRKVVAEAKAGKNPPLFTVVCMHYEWFIGTNGKTSEYGRWHEVFDEIGLDLAVAGNNHVYLRSHPLYHDNVVGDGQGTVYLQTPSSDDGRGRALHETEFQNSDKIKVRWSQGSHTIGAVHMAMDGATMTLELIDRDGKVLDSTRIVKNLSPKEKE